MVLAAAAQTAPRAGASRVTARPALDVSELPEGQRSSCALIWWGQVGMLVIEGTMLAMATGVYLYLRTVKGPWPPPTVATPDLTLPTIMLVVLLVSVIPMHIADTAAHEEQRSRTLVWLAVGALVCIMAVVLRWFELQSLDFKWYSHAYGSAVWLILGFHSFHLVASTVETIAMVILFASASLEHKHYIAARLDGLYWYWVVAWYVLFYVLLYVAPRIWR
jgi:cytochrome c oxidase subunit I+III